MTSPLFDTVAQAIDHIAIQLEKGNFEELAASCNSSNKLATAYYDGREFLSISSGRLWAIKALAEKHEELDLRKLYVNKEFPVDMDSFKLGGHAKELGHIHVDFIKLDEKWLLREIWMCR